MSHRRNFLEADNNFREQNLRFVRNDLEENLNQFFGGGQQSGGAPPRDYKVVQPKPGGGGGDPNFEIRKEFILQLGLSRQDAYNLTKRTFQVPNFDLDYFREKRHQLRLDGRKRQSDVDAIVVREINQCIRQNSGGGGGNGAGFGGGSSTGGGGGGPNGRNGGGPAGKTVGGPTGKKVGGPTGRNISGPTGRNVSGPTGRNVGGPTGRNVGGPTGRNVGGPTGKNGGGTTGTNGGGTTRKSGGGPTGRSGGGPTSRGVGGSTGRSGGSGPLNRVSDGGPTNKGGGGGGPASRGGSGPVGGSRGNYNPIISNSNNSNSNYAPHTERDFPIVHEPSPPRNINWGQSQREPSNSNYADAALFHRRPHVRSFSQERRTMRDAYNNSPPNNNYRSRSPSHDFRQAIGQFGGGNGGRGGGPNIYNTEQLQQQQQRPFNMGGYNNDNNFNPQQQSNPNFDNFTHDSPADAYNNASIQGGPANNFNNQYNNPSSSGNNFVGVRRDQSLSGAGNNFVGSRTNQAPSGAGNICIGGRGDQPSSNVGNYFVSGHRDQPSSNAGNSFVGVRRSHPSSNVSHNFVGGHRDQPQPLMQAQFNDIRNPDNNYDNFRCEAANNFGNMNNSFGGGNQQIQPSTNFDGPSRQFDDDRSRGARGVGNTNTFGSNFGHNLPNPQVNNYGNQNSIRNFDGPNMSAGGNFGPNDNGRQGSNNMRVNQNSTHANQQFSGGNRIDHNKDRFGNSGNQRNLDNFDNAQNLRRNFNNNYQNQDNFGNNNPPPMNYQNSQGDFDGSNGGGGPIRGSISSSARRRIRRRRNILDNNSNSNFNNNSPDMNFGNNFNDEQTALLAAVMGGGGEIAGPQDNQIDFTPLLKTFAANMQSNQAIGGVRGNLRFHPYAGTSAAVGRGGATAKKLPCIEAAKVLPGLQPLPDDFLAKMMLPQTPNESYALKLFLQKQPQLFFKPNINKKNSKPTPKTVETPNYDSDGDDAHSDHDSAKDEGGDDATDDTKTASEATKLINSKIPEDPRIIKKIWRGREKADSEKFWLNWWQEYKKVEPKLNDKLKDYRNVCMRHFMVFRDNSDPNKLKLKVNITFKNGCRLIKSIGGESFRVFKYIYKLKEPSFLQHLRRRDMQQLQKCIYTISNYDWKHIMMGMVMTWAHHEAFKKLSTAEFDAIFKKNKRRARQALAAFDRPDFHWMAKRALEQVKMISAKEWKGHATQYSKIK